MTLLSSVIPHILSADKNSVLTQLEQICFDIPFALSLSINHSIQKILSGLQELEQTTAKKIFPMKWFHKEKAPSTLFYNTDLHAHVLPGIDDGSQNPESSIALLKALQSWGIKQIFATPHVIADT